MKNFENFVDYVIKKWRKDKKTILESMGLGGLVNREYGDLAEDYILRRIKNLKPCYNAFKSSGSQSPADILSVARRNGYWHIMLVQVKSSDNINLIKKLNSNDKIVFDKFAKFLKSEITQSGLLDEYKDKPIIITTGYAAVLRLRSGHKLVDQQTFKIFKFNAQELNIEDVKEKIKNAHKL